MDNIEQNNKYFDFVFTKDKSVGLYNHKVEDIYHSSYGAKNEAVEKFIRPLKFSENFSKKQNIKVLDICYGIGYNTKAFLQECFKYKYQGNIEINILEYDKSLVLISPFLKDGFFERHPEISYVILSNLLEYIVENRKSIKDIFSKENTKYIEPFYRRLIKKYDIFGYNYSLLKKNNLFLHNIYYHCISERIKMPFKGPRINNFIIRPHFDDARITVQTLKNQYDIIFLDAFTPTKLPTLWSLDFFKRLFELITNDGILVTYSNSAAVRHAMQESGFIVGKIFDRNNRASGTIASKKTELIKEKLNNYDIGLLSTNAGVYFRDENLNNSPEDIILEWTERKQRLNLESSSHYIKSYKRNLKNE